MNWIDIHSRVDEGVTVGSFRINRLLFADHLVLLASSQQCLQCALNRLYAASDEVEWKSALNLRRRYLVSLETQVSVSCKWAAIHCTRWRSSSILEWYLRVTEDRTRRLIHGLVKLTQFCASFITLWRQTGSFQTPQSFQFLNRSLFRSSPIVMNLVQWLKECYLRCKRQSWDFCEDFTVCQFTTNCAAVKFAKPWISSHFFETRDPSYVGSAMCPECPTKDWQGKSCWLHPGKAAQRSSKDQVELLHRLPCLFPVSVRSQRNYLRLLLTIGYFES